MKSLKAKRTVMYQNRYKIGKFAGRSYIVDVGTVGNRDDVYAFGYGHGFHWLHVPFQEHRAAYTEIDAIHLVEWLNERNAGYPAGPAIPLVLRR